MAKSSVESKVQDLTLDVAEKIDVPVSVIQEVPAVVALKANRASKQRDDWVDDGDPSMTVTYGAEKLDINHIVNLYSQQGYTEQDFARMAQNIRNNGQYLDMSGISSIEDFENRIEQLQQTFQLIPADIRAAFGNDPTKFYSWAQNPMNHNQLVMLLRGSPHKEDLQVLNSEPVADTKKD